MLLKSLTYPKAAAIDQANWQRISIVALLARTADFINLG